MYELRADIRRVCLVSSLHTLHDPPFSHISTHPTTNQPTTTQVSYIVHFTRVLAGSEAEADRVAKLVQVTQQHEKNTTPRRSNQLPYTTHEPDRPTINQPFNSCGARRASSPRPSWRPSTPPRRARPPTTGGPLRPRPSCRRPCLSIPHTASPSRPSNSPRPSPTAAARWRPRPRRRCVVGCGLVIDHSLQVCADRL